MEENLRKSNSEKMKDYHIDIIYKKVKNINLKVKPSLEVILTVPFKTSKNRIDNLLNKKESWIKEKLEWFIENRPIETKKSYVNGESFLYLGRQYRLKIIKSSKEEVKLYRGFLTIYTNKANDKNYKKSLIDEWYYIRGNIIFEILLKKWSEKTRLYPENFRIRKMKTRWGSCNFLKKYININLELIKKQKYLIEYVILHELIHLKYNNHSKQFYNHLSIYMPDYKERKRKLEEQN